MAEPIRLPVPLTPQQRDQLDALYRDIQATPARDWFRAYQYIYNDIIGNRSDIDHNTRFWFEQAIKINQGEGNVGRFIYAYTLNGLQIAGKPSADMTVVTDNIARRVVEGVLRNSAIPDMSVILANDLVGAFTAAGIENLGGWGGTFYYWNIARMNPDGTPYQLKENGQPMTLGESIMANPAERNLFVQTLGKTLADFSGLETMVNMARDGDMRAAFVSLLELPTEVQDAAFAEARARSPLFRNAWRALLGPTPEDQREGAMFLQPIAYQPGQVQPLTPEQREQALRGMAEALEEFGRALRTDVDNIKRIEGYGDIGATFASSLGRALLHENAFRELTAGALLSALGRNLEQTIRNGGPVYQGQVLSHNVFDNFFEEFGQAFVGAGVGSISSYLTAELIEDLGLQGTVAELGQSLVAAHLTAVITGVAAGKSIREALAGVQVANLIGNYIGSKLAAELVQFDTIGGQIGSAVGTAVGAAAGAKIGMQYGAVWGPVGAAIGAFVGYIFGGLIGSLFGGTPRSGANIGWNDAAERFAVSYVWSKSGGSKDAARSFATSVAELLNSVLQASGSEVLDANAIRLGGYGMYKKDFVYRTGSGDSDITFRTRDANALINHGSAIALADLLPQMMGGDVFVKRAIAGTLRNSGVNATTTAAGAEGTFDARALMGNVSVAHDYGQYFHNAAAINALIAAEPESAFAAGWSITLATAFELGLHKRANTDWIGGWTAFLDQAAGGAIDGIAFAPSNLLLRIDGTTHERRFQFVDGAGAILGDFGDTIDSAGKDVIQGTAGADTIIVIGDRLANGAGLNINGAAGAAGQYLIEVAATINGGAGNDTIVGGDLGNDLFGGDGNDTLVGGKLDDWIFGEAGNDRLFAGGANYQFADGDIGATAAALNTVSNGDMLDGGAGDDVLYGSRGSDWLRGGDGVDTIYGGAGADIIDGGAGNDSNPDGTPRLFGGAGTDQYVFGYGSGIDVALDDADSVEPGTSGQDSIHTRIQNIASGTVARNWAGGGDYEADGSVKGGEDAIVFGAGIGMADLILQRSGDDLIVKLTAADSSGQRNRTGDEIVISDWFESTRRVEWLRFANGEEVRIGDISSFIVGTSASDIIIGTNESDFLYGGAGDDQLYGLDGDDFGFGGTGNDVVAGDADNDWVSGGRDNDKVMGGAGNDTVFGDDGNDQVYGGAGSDIVVGGRGDDLVVGGAGNDIIRYQRGDGRDVLIDEYVNNWEVVWQNGTYVNGYVQSNGVVTKDGVVYFDGAQWSGLYDYDQPTGTYRRHLGAVNGAMATNAGTDYLEFGVGIDIQDLMFRQTGNDLDIAITQGDGDATPFESVADRITIRDWYLAGGRTIENFVFVATGRHDIGATTLRGGNEGVDTFNGGAGSDWYTGNGGDDIINGNGGADILSGNAGSDQLRGGAGNDVLYGGEGADVLDGGTGADTIVGGASSDIASYASATGAAIGMRAFIGAAHTNTRDGAGDTYSGIEGLEGTTGADVLGGDAGQNVLRGIAGNDTLYGGAGDDIYEININHGQDVIRDQPFATEEVVNSSGVLNTDSFTASWINTGVEPDEWGGFIYYYQLIVTRNGSGEEVYHSGEYDFYSPYEMPEPPGGSDWPPSGWITGTGLATTPTATGNGAQVVREVFQNANGGNDTLEFGTDISLSDLTFARVNGGADLQITYRSGHFVTISGQNDANRAVESLHLQDGLSADLTRLVTVGQSATAAADFVVGDGNGNTLQGLGGDDVISGANGNDLLYGGDGDDVLEGGDGADTLDGGSDSVSAGLNPSATDQTRAYGDTIRYIRSNAAVQIDLAAATAAGGHAAGDVIVTNGGVATIENVVGSDLFGDTLRGDARANRLWGFGGADLIEGGGGADVLVGGLGDDTLRGGDGEDDLAGEEGIDILEGGNGKDLLAGGDGNDTLSGDAGDDLLSGDSGDDVLHGGADNDRLGGDAGADQLYGDAGADQLAGGDGNDILYGGDGNDVLAGDAGDDQLYGEAGDDTFVFGTATGADVVVDASGANRIAIDGAEFSKIWLTRAGNDLRIGVIGGTTSITIQNYYASSTPTRVREVMLQGSSLFTAYSEPLIAAMTAWTQANGGAMPASIPPAIASMLGTYWHAAGQASPTVTDQTLSVNEDTPLTGSVGAVDHDENIVSYGVEAQPTRGSITLNTTMGNWTYTPGANLYGQDRFQLVVTDANNNRSVQTVTVNVTSVNDAPSDIALTGTMQIEERDRPPAGTLLTPIVLGTLSATDVDYPDPGDFDDHVFSVADSRFEIVDGTTLRLRAGAALDFEASPTVTVAITVTDRNGAGLSFTRNFTFTVLDRDDYLYGTPGNDVLTGQAGRNLIYGYAGNDTINGAGANDDLDGGDGNDQLFGSGGDDLLLGGLGDDLLEGGAGADVLRGGDGVDTIRGQDGADRLFGDGGDDLLQGGLGDDQLDGGTHSDRLEGGDGADVLVGGSGDDFLNGGAGADRFLGGDGFDTVTYETASAGVTVNVTTSAGSTGEAAGDVFDDVIERIVGSSFDDVITGGAASERLEGGAGNDTIYGGAGDDTLIGGDGNDTLNAQAGNDTLVGGAGSDTLIGGDDSDTYLMDITSGADTILNYDPNGTDIDVVGYQNLNRTQLWFQKSGNDLIVSVIGTSVRTTIRDWYLVASANDRANYKIDFIIAGDRVTETIDAESLVQLMSNYTPPTTQAEFDALRATPAFNNPWSLAWRLNAPPIVPTLNNATINEDGTLSLSINITDDFTPTAGISVQVQASDTNIVSPPTISPPDSSGVRTLTVNTRPNASGAVTITVTATDAGGLVTTRSFQLNVSAVADTPVITLAQVATPTAPLTKPTLDSGSWAINLQAALVDQDGSETLEVRVANVPTGITFSGGTNLGGGVWSFTPAQLPGLLIHGPADWSQDLALSITAISREASNGSTATSAPTQLNIVINARPTDIAADRTLAFNENTAAGTSLATFLRTDGDVGDTATFELLNNAGGRFALSSGGVLTAGSTILDYETASSHTITVRVTDSGGLSRTEDFIVNVNNVNEAPFNVRADRTLGFNENTGAGTGLAWIQASDPENNIASYSLVNDAGGRFTMRSDGLLSAGSTPLNYEAATGHWITVRVTDTGGLSTDQNFFVNVYNLNEAPVINPATFAIYEGANGGPGNYLHTTSGDYARVTGSDPEGATLSWQAVGGDTSVISIDSSGYLHNQGVLDYETRPSYSVLARAWDGGAVGAGNYTDQWVTINTQNVLENPTISISGTSPAANLGYLVYAFTINGYDPDLSPMTYEVVSSYGYYWGWYVEGSYYSEFRGWSSLEYGPPGLTIDTAGNVYLEYAVEGNSDPTGWWQTYKQYEGYHLNVRVRDASGAVSQTIGVTTSINGGAPVIGGEYPWATLPPVVLDLDGDGIDLVSFAESNVTFRMERNAQATRTGWVGADDGVLALDRDGDGAITHGAEISFVGDVAGAKSDLEGLAAFDTDHDGLFDADDARYGEFRVWRDLNQDGVSQSNELTTLAEQGIVSISLTRALTGRTQSGIDNVITATSQFTRADGTTGLVGDVELTYEGAAGPDAPSTPSGTGDSTTIGNVDRSAHDETNTAPAGASQFDAPSLPAQPPFDVEGQPARIAPVASDDGEKDSPRERPWRWSDLQGMDNADDDSDDAYASGVQPGALHASLDSVVRRRLQMIEAMASFAPEGASRLELQPHRKVDQRTLELLTMVPEVRVM